MDAVGSITAVAPNLGAAADADAAGVGAATAAAAVAASTSSASAAGGGAAAAAVAAGAPARARAAPVAAPLPLSLSQQSSEARALANPQEGSIAAHRVAVLRTGKNILASRNGLASALTTACHAHKQQDGCVNDINYC